MMKLTLALMMLICGLAAAEEYNYAGFWKALPSGNYFNYSGIYDGEAGDLEIFMTKDGHVFLKVNGTEYNGNWEEEILPSSYLSVASITEKPLKTIRLFELRKAVPPSEIGRYTEQEIEAPLILIITRTMGEGAFAAYVGEFRNDPKKLQLRMETFSR